MHFEVLTYYIQIPDITWLGLYKIVCLSRASYIMEEILSLEGKSFDFKKIALIFCLSGTLWASCVAVVKEKQVAHLSALLLTLLS